MFVESHFGSTVIFLLYIYIFYRVTAGVYPHNNYCTSEGAKLVLWHVRSVGRGVERVKKSPLRLGLPHLVPSGSDEIVSHTAGSPGAPAFVTRFSRTCHFRRNLLSCRVFTIMWWMWLYSYTVPPLTTPLENKVLRTLLCHGTSISVLESSYWLGKIPYLVSKNAENAFYMTIGNVALLAGPNPECCVCCVVWFGAFCSRPQWVGNHC